jgi:hypothetical protein
MRRLWLSSIFALVLGVIWAPSASAQQMVNFNIGGFTPRGLDGRGADDVLFQNSTFLSTLNSLNGIDIGQFDGWTVGGEYLIALGRLFEAGGGVGFYQRTVPTTYTSVVNSNGTEIAQQIQLRIVPISATVRFLPLGHRSPVQPYIGGGVGVFVWRYAETGQFVDANNNIFFGNYVGSGAEVGPMVLGGVRFGSGPIGFGGEIRWQDAKATLPADQGFAGPRLDLSGISYLFTMHFRF